MIARSSLVLVLCALPTAPAQQPKFIPAGYSVEKIATPKGVAFGVGGLSFASDGTLFVCTREGQVWKYRKGEWHLYAEGLHEPLGILVTPDSGRVFVVQRPELTELLDEDGDGKVDRFKTVSAGWGLTDNYHEYAFGLVRDSKGNFYGTLNTSLSWKGWAGSSKWDIARVHDGKMGRAAPYRGWSFRVTPAGKFEPWSAGLRSPCGIGISPDDEIFYTDNQGDWNASSTLHHVVKGRFHGHPSSLMDHPKFKEVDLNSISVKEYDEMRTPPAVFIPHGELANSPGEPVFDTTGGKFGPFQGQMFIGDQTRSNVFRVIVEKVGGFYQGCAINFVDHLEAGVVRSRFAADGSLWVGETGRGWGSRGAAQYGLDRIVWDGKTVPFAIHSVSLRKDGFRIRFTSPLAVAKAVHPAVYKVERWHYKYQPDYGSPKVARSTIEVRTVGIQADARSVDLGMKVEAGWIYKFTLTVVGADDQQLANKVAWYTLNRLRD